MQRPLVAGAAQEGDGGPEVHAKRARHSPQSPPLTSVPRFSSLSSDLLRVIFSYIPPRPRIFVIGAVCERWRKVSLGTIAELSWMPPTSPSSFEHLTNVFSRLTRLPDIAVDSVEDQAFWQRLPDLYCVTTHSVPDSTRPIRADVDFLRQFTGLTHLSLSACSLKHLRESGLNVSRFSGITRLSILPSPNEFLKVAPPIVDSVHLPHLTSFDLRDNTRPSIGKQILIAHMSQLRSLSLDTRALHCAFDDIFAGLWMPHLASFALAARVAVPLSILLHSISTTMPSLSALSLSSLVFIREDDSKKALPLPSSLRSVTMSHVAPTDQLIATFAPYVTKMLCALPQSGHEQFPFLTSVKTLALEALSAPTLFHHADTLLRLQKVTLMSVTLAVPSRFYTATSLRSLTLVNVFADAMEALFDAFSRRRWVLTRLNKLCFRTTSAHTPHNFAVEQLIVRLLYSWPFPHLRHLKFASIEGDRGNTMLGILLPLLPELERHGVERVTFRRMASEFRTLVDAKRRELKWLDVDF